MSESVLPNHLINFSEKSLLKLPLSLYKNCKNYLSSKDIKKIQKAYSFAFYAHSGQKRKDGSDYIFISAPENVAWLLNIRGRDILLVLYLIVE